MGWLDFRKRKGSDDAVPDHAPKVIKKTFDFADPASFGPMPESNVPLPDEAAEDLLGDDDEDTSTSKRLFPYQNEHRVRRAAEQYANRNTPDFQKRRILDTLMISRPQVIAAVPTLLEQFPREDVDNKHTFLDLFDRLVKDGQDLSPFADTLAKVMADPNFALRQKAAELMVNMGPMAQPATARIVGYLRHKLPDVATSAARVLAEIGPAASKLAVPKLVSNLQASRDPEFQREASRALDRMRVEEEEPRGRDRTRDTEEVLRIHKSADGTLRLDGAETQGETQVRRGALPDSARDEAMAERYPNLSLRRILVLEDEDEMRRVLVRSLSAAGCDVLEARHGQEGWDLLQEAQLDGHPVELILLDLMMPVMNGGEFLKRLRADDVAGHLPVFVITARRDRALLMALAKLEVSGFFAKPYKIEDILTRMNTALAIQ